MTMRKTIEVVTKLAEKRVIGNYAIAGAVAALNYIQPMLTEDLDILISIDGFEKHSSGLLLLGPIEKALTEMATPSGPISDSRSGTGRFNFCRSHHRLRTKPSNRLSRWTSRVLVSLP